MRSLPYPVPKYQQNIQWGCREQDLQRQISLTKTQLRDLRMSNESNQAKLLDHSQRQGTASSIFFFYLSSVLFLLPIHQPTIVIPNSISVYAVLILTLGVVDNEVVTKLAEVDMIVADLERANSRVATVERRNVSSFSPKIQYTTNPSLQEILRAEIESLRTGTETSALVKNLSSQITDLESECDRLSQALDAQKSLVGEAEERLGKRVEDVEREGRGKVLFFLD